MSAAESDPGPKMTYIVYHSSKHNITIAANMLLAYQMLVAGSDWLGLGTKTT